jgi:UDP-N-acetylglucosamine 4,6-dehydratase
MSILTKKSILVTGGTGSIGSALVQRALKDKAKLIKIFSNDENGLFELESNLGAHKSLEYVYGDIKDEKSVDDAAKNIDIIFHAAALKHVDRCEIYPFEAITVNVLGTKNLIVSAIKHNVKKVILISTDKAVNPIGVLGATKLLGEKLIVAESLHKNSNTIFTSVRFGNVLNTRGSILPRIENQIKNGGPITLTDKRMVRFFLSKEQSVKLILSATKLAKGGETFVLKMSLLRLEDLFESMKEILSSKYGYKPSQIKTKVIGLRPGEKLIEHLLNVFEMENVVETKDFFIIPSLNEPVNSLKYPNSKKPENIKKYFDTLSPISKNEIIKLLKTIY